MRSSGKTLVASNRRTVGHGVAGSAEASPRGDGPATTVSMVRCRWSGKAPGPASGSHEGRRYAPMSMGAERAKSPSRVVNRRNG